MSFLEKYLKYKRKYIQQKYNHMTAGGNNNFDLTNDEVTYLKNTYRFLIHYTSFSNFEKIMKDMYLKASPKSNSRVPVIFFELVCKKCSIITKWTTKRNIGIIIDLELLFDKNAYYFYSPGGEHGEYEVDTIPGPNIRKLLSIDDKDRDNYINKLNINEETKNDLINYNNIFLTNVEADEYNKFNENIRQHYFMELCVFDKVDLKKYMTGVVCLDEKLKDKVEELIPKNVKIYKMKKQDKVFNSDEYLDYMSR